MAGKKGKRNSSGDNCGERQWNLNMIGEVRSLSSCSAVESVYIYVCVYIYMCVVHIYKHAYVCIYIGRK